MFALIIGVIVGTYSSVFIATPVMYETLKKSLKK
jgi:SecD/SecF fusion protein